MSNGSLEIASANALPWYKEINRKQWNALIGAFVGWTLDAFDFLIFNYTIVTLIKEWGLSAGMLGMGAGMAMISSAFGGMFFGFIADRFGRLRALTITILIYAVATALCGFAQNFWQLMAFRIIVGLGMGGEWSAGAALVSETWPAKHRGKAMSIMQSGWALGGVLASFIAGPIIAEWGWRAIYFIGILPAIVAWWIRKNVEEPEVWTKNQSAVQAGQCDKVSWLELFKGKELKATLTGSLFCVIGLVACYPQGVWLSPWIGAPVAKGGLGLSVVQASMYLMPYYVGCIAGYFAFGWICDKIGRKPTFILYFIMAGITLPLLILNGVSNMVLFFTLLVFTGWFGVGMYGGYGMVVGEMYPTRCRASGTGFCYNLARGAAGFGIMGAGALAQVYGFGPTLMYSAALFALAVLAVFILPETKGTEFN